MNQRSDLPNSTRKGLKFALCYPYFSFLEARLGLWICLKHNKVIPIGTRGQQVGDISTVTQPVWSNSWAWASRKIEQVASCNLFLVISNVYLDHPFNGQCKHLWTARIFSSCETFIVHRMDRNSGNAFVHFALWVGLYVLYYPCAFQKKKKKKQHVFSGTYCFTGSRIYSIICCATSDSPLKKLCLPYEAWPVACLRAWHLWG